MDSFYDITDDYEDSEKDWEQMGKDAEKRMAKLRKQYDKASKDYAALQRAGWIMLLANAEVARLESCRISDELREMEYTWEGWDK